MTLSKDELLKEYEVLLADVLAEYSSHELSTPDSPSVFPQASVESPTQSEIYKFYYKKLSEPTVFNNTLDDLKWLDGVKGVIDEIELCLRSFAEQIDSVELEKKQMLAELSGLDGKAKHQLAQQAILEKEVAGLELEVNSVKVVRDVDALMNRKEILLSNFSKFEGIVKSLDLVSGDMRQYDHLKSKVCSLGVSVGTAAIEVYTKRMLQYIEDKEGSAVSSMSLFGKFSETLTVITKLSLLFGGSKPDREFSMAVSELEKVFADARERILIPVLGQYIQTILKSECLSNSIRRTVYFAESFANQESSFFISVFGKERKLGDALSGLLRAMGLAMYYPLRTGVIVSEDLSDLRESAEVIRLEVLTLKTSFSFILNVAFKLHRDVQERLIYRIEAFIRDNIRRFADWSESRSCEPVEKTFECLALITGVVDYQTFHEIANEAVSVCVDVLAEVPVSVFPSEEDRYLFLIAQLLALRERITSIDCEMGTSFSASSSRTTSIRSDHRAVPVGITDQFKRLWFSRSYHGEDKESSTMIRLKIETQLRSVCDQFTAHVVAKLRTDPTKLEETKSKIKFHLKKSASENNLENVLLRPIMDRIDI